MVAMTWNSSADIGIIWLKRYRTPNWDKWLRPYAWCPSCGEVVRGIYNPKPGPRRPMRYDAQYTYRCPQIRCRGVKVQPYVVPAAAAIDWSLPAQRIGDRKTPLAPKTYARIAAGLRRYARPFVPELAGHTFERRPGVRTRPVDMPFTTQHTTASKGLVCPPMLAPTGGSWNDDATPMDDPMRTRTTREFEAVVTPPPFLTVLRSDRPRTIDLHEPLATVVADGSNHALVEPVVVSTSGRDNSGAAPPGRRAAARADRPPRARPRGAAAQPRPRPAGERPSAGHARRRG